MSKQNRHYLEGQALQIMKEIDEIDKIWDRLNKYIIR